MSRRSCNLAMLSKHVSAGYKKVIGSFLNILGSLWGSVLGSVVGGSLEAVGVCLGVCLGSQCGGLTVRQREAGYSHYGDR